MAEHEVMSGACYVTLTAGDLSNAMKMCHRSRNFDCLHQLLSTCRLQLATGVLLGPLVQAVATAARTCHVWLLRLLLSLLGDFEGH